MSILSKLRKMFESRHDNMHIEIEDDVLIVSDAYKKVLKKIKTEDILEIKYGNLDHEHAFGDYWDVHDLKTVISFPSHSINVSDFMKYFKLKYQKIEKGQTISVWKKNETQH